MSRNPMTIVRRPEEEQKRTAPVLDPMERTKMAMLAVLSLTVSEQYRRLCNVELREAMKDKDLADWSDKAAKYLLPRDIRISIADPLVLQSIARMTAELMEPEAMEMWTMRLQGLLAGTAVSKHMKANSVTIDMVEDLVDA